MNEKNIFHKNKKPQSSWVENWGKKIYFIPQLFLSPRRNIEQMLAGLLAYPLCSGFTVAGQLPNFRLTNHGIPIFISNYFTAFETPTVILKRTKLQQIVIPYALLAASFGKSFIESS